MSYLVLDTDIISGIIKQDPFVVQALQRDFAPMATRSYAISIVTRAELNVMAYFNSWGPQRAQLLEKILAQCLEIPIASDDIVAAFAELEAFRRNKPVPGRPQLGRSVGMGENDLWIAATTYVLKAELLTVDSDFVHLDGVYFPVHLLRR